MDLKVSYHSALVSSLAWALLDHSFAWMVKIPKRSVAVWPLSAFSDRSHFYSQKFDCFASSMICGFLTLQCSADGGFVCLIVVRITCLNDGEFQLGRPLI